MKKRLLFLASLVFCSGTTLGQFTQLNEPIVTENALLYVIDSSAVAYENTTGTDVTWNYGMYGGYNGESRLLTVYDAAATVESASYPSAQTATGIEDFLLTYNSSTVDDRTSHGFIFNEPGFGEIIIKLDVDPALHYQYPMVVGDQITDLFEGNMDFELSGVPQTLPIYGDHTASVDGSGTLELANGLTLTDVIRYKIVEKINIDNAPIVGDLVLDRVQYEYYKHSLSNLPVLIHTSGILQPKGGGDPLFDYTLVMSSEDPAGTVSLAVQDIRETKVYPNPASDILTVQLAQPAKNVKVVVLDNLGKVVMEDVMNTKLKQLDVSTLEHGLYFVQLSSGDLTHTKKIIVR